ncbi:MAG TPA: hypothetical protein VEB21_00190 [Terriglobales bacterium]|nr:hypothetical protein [Terriglobales bacterium]
MQAARYLGKLDPRRIFWITGIAIIATATFSSDRVHDWIIRLPRAAAARAEPLPAELEKMFLGSLQSPPRLSPAQVRGRIQRRRGAEAARLAGRIEEVRALRRDLRRRAEVAATAPLRPALRRPGELADQLLK